MAKGYIYLIENMKAFYLEYLLLPKLAYLKIPCLISLNIPNFQKNFVLRKVKHFVHLSEVMKSPLKVT